MRVSIGGIGGMATTPTTPTSTTPVTPVGGGGLARTAVQRLSLGSPGGPLTRRAGGSGGGGAGGAAEGEGGGGAAGGSHGGSHVQDPLAGSMDNPWWEDEVGRFLRDA